MILLHQNERIYLIKRKHPILLKLQLFPLVLLFILNLVIIVFLAFSKIQWPVFLMEIFPQLYKYNLKIFLMFVSSLFLPLIWGLIFLVLISYVFTYWVVTNQRVIFAKFKGLFSIEFSEVSYEKIQDISMYIGGFLASWFRFGNIRLQTASEAGQFFMVGVENPEIVKKIIVEAKEDHLQKIYDNKSN